MQKINKEVLEKRKWDLENNSRGAETSVDLLDANTVHHKSALEEDCLQWTGVNRLLSADEIIRLDSIDKLENNNVA